MVHYVDEPFHGKHGYFRPGSVVSFQPFIFAKKINPTPYPSQAHAPSISLLENGQLSASHTFTIYLVIKARSAPIEHPP